MNICIRKKEEGSRGQARRFSGVVVMIAARSRSTEDQWGAERLDESISHFALDARPNRGALWAE